MDFKSLRIAFALLLPLLWVDGVWATQCPDTDYILTSQAQVDALGQTGCTSVSGYVSIGNSSDITNLEGLSGLTSIAGDLVIRNNAALTNLDALAHLTSVGVNLYIYSNAALTNLDGLANLNSVGGDLTIIYNGALTNLDGLASLTSVEGYLQIHSNAALTNLDGLANLNSVGGDLSVTHNRVLANCQGITPVLGWPSGPPDANVEGDITIEENTAGCNSVAEILASVPIQAPSAPTIASTDFEDGKIILTVSVSDNGGAEITRYEATCTDSTNTYIGTSTSSPVTVSGLTNGVAYTCTVTATNSVGVSSASSATDPITPEAAATGLPIWLLYQATQ